MGKSPGKSRFASKFKHGWRTSPIRISNETVGVGGRFSCVRSLLELKSITSLDKNMLLFCGRLWMRVFVRIEKMCTTEPRDMDYRTTKIENRYKHKYRQQYGWLSVDVLRVPFVTREGTTEFTSPSPPPGRTYWTWNGMRSKYGLPVVMKIYSLPLAFEREKSYSRGAVLFVSKTSDEMKMIHDALPGVS